MWMVLLSALGWADTGDEEYCETSRAGGVLRGLTCVFERVEEYCLTDCPSVDKFLNGGGSESELWACAPGSDFSYIYDAFPSEIDPGMTIWFDAEDNHPVALHGADRVCCENVIVYHLEAGYPGHDALGTCYAPVYAQREQLRDPTSQTCEPTPEGKGCATARSAPLWPGLLALLLLRVRR